MDFAQPKVIERGNNLQVVHGDDSRLFVEFSLEPIKQEAESEKQGRPIFRDVPHIRIHFPGDRTKQIFRPVKMEGDFQTPSDPDRFPRQWAAFKAQAEQVQEGTPLEEWSALTRSQVMEFKSLHIHTVEQLAGVADTNLTWLGARQLRDKAIAWLKNADGGKEAMRLQVENEQLRADLELQKAQTKDLADRLDELSSRVDAQGSGTPTKKATRQSGD